MVSVDVKHHVFLTPTHPYTSSLSLEGSRTVLEMKHKTELSCAAGITGTITISVATRKILSLGKITLEVAPTLGVN